MEGEFARTIGSAVKALAKVGSRSMLERTIASARNIGIERVAVVGGAEVRAACGSLADKVVDERPSGAENLSLALHAWDDAPLLYLTSDMPFVDAASLRAFLHASPPATLTVPIAEWPAFQMRFPGAPQFGTRIGRERVVNGGAFLIPGASAPRIEAAARDFFDARKSLWRMASLLGPMLLLRFACRRLSIAALERHACKMLRMPALAVRDAPPELAYDVDTLEEYRYAVARA